MENKNLKPYVMVVEDDPASAAIIQYNLLKAGYRIKVIDHGDNVLPSIIEKKPDLIVLDIMLPGKSGMEICTTLRNNHNTANIPILMCSAMNDDIAKVTGLEQGADDYLIKPFSPMELSARIHALLRRIHPAVTKKQMCAGDITIDIISHQAIRNGMELELTPIEFQILCIMIESQNVVFSRQMFIEKIWDESAEVDERTIDVHITGLRKELIKAAPNGSDPIKTIRKKGYKFVACSTPQTTCEKNN